MLALFLCTTFLLSHGGEVVVGKSYDWNMSQGFVIVNPKGVRKQALPMTPNPARWLSKHASVTFNQYGRELPNGGMNDAGLVVEVMWLDSSVYPQPDARPTVTELQWIQYQLDNFATVKEMVDAAGDVRVQLIHGKVHYLACDKSADCAAFELLDGKMVVSHPAHALTNNTYAESVAFKGNHKGEGSLQRFARVNELKPKGDLTKAAFAALDDVSNSSSVWNIVYDPVHLKVAFRTVEDKRIKTFDFSKLDKSCAAPLLDLHADAAGDVTAKFHAYSEDDNRKLVAKSLQPIQGELPPGAVEMLVKYPSMLECAR